MKSSFCIDLQRFMLIPTKFPLSPELSQTQPRGYNLKLTTKQMPHGMHLFMGFPYGVCMKIRSAYFRSVCIVFVLVSGEGRAKSWFSNLHQSGMEWHAEQTNGWCQ